MDRKQRVLEYITSDAYIPLKLRELKVVLDVPEEDGEKLAAIISELEAEAKIFFSKRGRILPVTESENIVAGKLIFNSGGRFGFVVRPDGDDIYVSSKDFGMSLHGDTVIVKITGNRNGKPEGSVVRVAERSKSPVIGVVITKKGKLLRIKPDNKSFYHDIFVSEAESMGAEVGMRVSVEGVRLNFDRRVFGKISAVLGNSDSIKSLVSAIVAENKIKTEFEYDTLKYCEKISPEISWDSNSREDLRGMTIFTIDGELARDFDDAVSIQVSDSGVFSLGVHIADVSEYVCENTPLDEEAFKRGTSVYLPDRVIPMLPEKLSNGICSLNPGVDRLTLSVFMDIDSEGNVIKHKIVKSVINSAERLTYTDVNKVLTQNNESLTKKYAHILNDLKSMERLAQLLRKKRFERGALDFDFPESEILTDKDGNPVDVRMVERGVSNRMIEEFMLVANETVAEFAYWSELPIVYRSHEAPSEEKLAAFRRFLIPFGLTIKGKTDENNPVKPKAFEQIINKVKGTPVERIVSKTMLRSLMKADYKAVNTGHFGLAAKYYCHFTSPIRRYPDLLVHRSIKRMLDGEGFPDVSKLHVASKHSSEREVSAELCERCCDDLMKAAYMRMLIGMDIDGVISGITSFGMFVEASNGIEGLVRVENMNADYFVYNEEKQSLTGERTGLVYTVGDEVSVFVAGSDIVSRRIDFVLSEDADKKTLTHFKKKSTDYKRRKK